MTASEAAAAEVVAAIEEMAGKAFSPTTHKFYIDALSAWPSDAIRSGYKLMLLHRTKDSIPKPAEIIGYIRQQAAEERAVDKAATKDEIVITEHDHAMRRLTLAFMRDEGLNLPGTAPAGKAKRFAGMDGFHDRMRDYFRRHADEYGVDLGRALAAVAKDEARFR